MSIDEIYTEAFYKENLDNRAAYNLLGDAIHAVIGPKVSVFDLGCGSGLVSARLFELGHDVWGCDGSKNAIAACPEEIRSRIQLLDFREAAPEALCHTVVCIEVAEHLEAQYADQLVTMACHTALEQIVWSAAYPGQGGTDHVNEQPPSYWLDRFLSHGWTQDREASEKLRSLMVSTHAQHEYCAQNFYLLRK